MWGKTWLWINADYYIKKWITLPEFCCSLSASNLAFSVADFDKEADGSNWNVRK